MERRLLDGARSKPSRPPPAASEAASERATADSQVAFVAALRGAYDTLQESGRVAQALRPSADKLPPEAYWFARLYELITLAEIQHRGRLSHPAFVLHFIPEFYELYRRNLDAYRGAFPGTLDPAKTQMYAAAVLKKSDPTAFINRVVAGKMMTADPRATRPPHPELPAKANSTLSKAALEWFASTHVTPSWFVHFSRGGTHDDLAVELTEFLAQQSGYNTRDPRDPDAIDRTLEIRAWVRSHGPDIARALRSLSQVSYIRNITDTTLRGVQAHVQGDMAHALASSYKSFDALYDEVPEFAEYYQDFFANNRPAFIQSRLAMVTELFALFGVQPDDTEWLLGTGDTLGIGSPIEEIYHWRAQAWRDARSAIAAWRAERRRSGEAPREPTSGASRFWPPAGPVFVEYDEHPLVFKPNRRDGTTGTVRGARGLSGGFYEVEKNSAEGDRLQLKAYLRLFLVLGRDVEVSIHDRSVSVFHDRHSGSGKLSGDGSQRSPFHLEYRDGGDVVHTMRWYF